MLKLFIKQLKEMLPQYLSRQADIKNENIRLDVSARGLIPVLRFLRDHSLTQCKQLIEIAAVDMPKNAKHRFSVNYALYSPRFSNRLIVNTQVNELEPIPTSTVLFQSAN
jgi:NADH dehydrogenase (ubiquinone) Fe-S protein 3